MTTTGSFTARTTLLSAATGTYASDLASGLRGDLPLWTKKFAEAAVVCTIACTCLDHVEHTYLPDRSEEVPMETRK